jgi:hypothetical protein
MQDRDYICEVCTTSRHGCPAKQPPGEMERRRSFIRDDIPNIGRAITRHLDWAKDMESSKRYLLQAEIEYWHEMLRLNQSRLPKNKEEEMRACLKRAVRSLNSNSLENARAAA